MHDRKESLQLTCACQHRDVILLKAIAVGLASEKSVIVWLFIGPTVDVSDAGWRMSDVVQSQRFRWCAQPMWKQ